MKELTKEDELLGLKQPQKNGQQVPRAVISVLGEDKVGIIATLSRVIADYQGNIVQINQSIIQGMFSMIMIVETDKLTVDFEEFKHSLESKREELGVRVVVQSEKVFRYMHRI